MAKLTLEELKKLREEKRKELNNRRTEGKDVQVIVGMGTCGIAAGAKDTFDAFLKEIDQSGLTNVTIRQTGCMGLCHSEPTVEVIVPDMPSVVYGNVNPDVAQRIVRKHIVGKIMINDHIFDKPAADIIK
ncbi:MAG TPA: NAD(P)-dependent iron-only hydrogenase iron-sulfur protein [Verrucomicrobia bacterium]|nr:MAG: NAD(P)-dependent iron-only hydrogenase iron-sulfur protein [Lentisphaerae bacterium GWF2_57_35]HBA83600.1 NAD(P)-dependent iron-only hydrogenase iron-sulfur protein [Verrucomicrobiota bacterium]